MANIHFGTDGWRAIIGEDFTEENLIRIVDAAAAVFKEEATSFGKTSDDLGILYVGHDCRRDAHAYAQLAAEVASSHGFTVLLSNDYCPTPALCWIVSRTKNAIGGIMLTSSHNPAEYLGVKIRMADGGASPRTFTNRVESALPPIPTANRGPYEEVNFVDEYLASLKGLVDIDAIRKAQPRIVVDPLYGAGRKHLARLLREVGVQVAEINNTEDPSFDGLHPEPIPPWVNRGLLKTKELSYDACFFTDGDGDRIGAGDENGNFVNPHRIFSLLTQHMLECGERGRVVSTVTSSALLSRVCKKHNLELTITPVGFKWIYEEMNKGDVMIGGEESGGIGLPGHIKERDGLLMALLLTEMMAKRQMSLGELVENLLADVGKLEFDRRGLTVTNDRMDIVRNQIVPFYAPDSICGNRVLEVDRRDGVRFFLEHDAWVMMRPSGTEPLVRVYAEAATIEKVETLLDAAELVVREESPSLWR